MTFRAPGKVILFGEYAVLSGYQALVVAVDRFAKLTEKEAHDFRIVAHGLGTYAPTEGLRELPFARALHERCPELKGHWHTNTDEFKSDDGKLGLGSSAAATVLMAAAALPSSERNKRTIFQLAQDTHRSVQGLGSGADIAASVFGGALSYRWFDASRGDSEELEDPIQTRYGHAEVKHLESGFSNIRMVWTGRSADTRTLVRQVQAWADQSPQEYAAHLEAIQQASALGCTSWIQGNRAGMCTAIRIGCRAMRDLSTAADVELFAPAHAEIAQLIGPRGAMKPTGAGGGDLAWFMGESPEHEEDMSSVLKRAGYPVYRFSIADGVRHGTDD